MNFGPVLCIFVPISFRIDSYKTLYKIAWNEFGKISSSFLSLISTETDGILRLLQMPVLLPVTDRKRNGDESAYLYPIIKHSDTCGRPLSQVINDFPHRKCNE